VRIAVWILILKADIEISILYGSILWIELGIEVRIVVCVTGDDEIGILIGFIDEIELWIDFIVL
jgi:hypothetical protein